MIDSFVEECHGNPSFVSWLRTHTLFFTVEELLLFVMVNCFMNPPPQGPLCGSPTWRTSTSVFVNNSCLLIMQGEISHEQRIIIHLAWPMESENAVASGLPLSTAPWGGCRRCLISAETFSLICVAGALLIGNRDWDVTWALPGCLQSTACWWTTRTPASYLGHDFH